MHQLSLLIGNKLDTHDELSLWQLQDEKISMVLKWMEDKNNNTLSQEYKSKCDLLKIPNGLLTYFLCGNYLIVAPEVKREEIITIAHSHFSVGHFDIFKTHQRVLEKFWWPGLFDNVRRFVAD